MSAIKDSFERKTKKLLDKLEIESHVKLGLLARLNRELDIIETYKLYPAFKKKEGRKFKLITLIKKDCLSVAGYLTGSLHAMESPTPMVTIIDFVKRAKECSLVKMGKVSDRQIQELILHGAFGKPEAAMKEYWAYAHPKDELEDINYDKELSIRMQSIRKIDIDDIEKQIEMTITPYELYMAPSFYKLQIAIVGQLMELPKNILTKTGKDMAFITLRALDTNTDFDNPNFDIVVWPNAYNKLVELNVIIGDVLVIVGKRGYNKNRKHPQVTIDSSDYIYLVQ